MRNGNERAKTQWFAKQEQIGRLLRSAEETFRDPEDKMIIGDLIRDQESLFNLFSGIVKNREGDRAGHATLCALPGDRKQT